MAGIRILYKALYKDQLRKYLINPGLDLDDAQAVSNALQLQQRPWRKLLNDSLEQMGVPEVTRQMYISSKVIPEDVVVTVIRNYGKMYGLKVVEGQRR